MSRLQPYLIRRAIPADLPRLAHWRSLPHVRRWWGGPEIEPEAEKLADPRIRAWIAEQAGRPFAFLQDYLVADWRPHPFDHLPTGACGLDLYIGELDMLGQGHGSALLRQHVEDLFSHGAPAAGIDPHPDNAPAIRAFEKAGFKVTSAPVETRWGRAVLMERHAPSPSSRT